MACLEYACTKCNWLDFGNRAVNTCPKCGAKVRTYFDEMPERDEDTEYDGESDGENDTRGDD